MDESTAYWVLVSIFALGLGAVTAKVASDRGVAGQPLFWFIAGVFLGIVALPLAILSKPDQATLDERSLHGGETKKCPRCAEMVKSEATICRFCSYAFPAPGAMPCPQCGQSILREAVRCRHCGKQLRARA